ncbi:condensin-2 complex subunit H2 [Narcine bancroftii]|uniref:condensin-2 complex subunit H2 n=1 Tax=Narcine bancroftii TaxID=1343680 RepID=UPI003831C5DD
MEDVESRFAHLLQPIRELTKNWEIDVAAQLGEYLEELDQICISFDDGKTTMNFAEAALLIQGSACIYSRKVEYLYSLVYQALDLISNKKRNQKASSIGENGTDNDLSLDNQKREWEFLSLDDIECPTTNKIDMRKDASFPVVNVVPLTPLALIPPEELEKKNNPLFSRRGEILGSRKDFRMNTCTPHATGAFMLELNNASPMNFLNKQQQDKAVHDRNDLQGVTQDVVMENSDCQTPVPKLNFLNDVGPTGSDDEGGGDVDDGLPPQLPEGNVDQECVVQQKGACETQGYMLREKRVMAIDPVDRKEMLNPWRSLDPFEATQDKPFKNGRHLLIPSCISVTGSKRKRKSSNKLKEFGKWFSVTYYGTQNDMKSKRRGPMFADMEVLYWKHMKERLGAQRKYQQRMIVLRGRVMEMLGAKAVEEELNKSLELAEDHLEYDELEDDNGIDLGCEAIGTQDNHSPINLGHLGESGCVSYEELVRRNVEMFIANSQQYTQETALSLRVKEWEEKIGPRLEKEEEQATFAIHDYGDKIVQAFDYVKQRLSFANIVAGKEPFEVCRYMLASLQLANDYTVELWQRDGLYESVDTMELTLLSRVRAHDRFQTYMAPSLSNK